MIFSAGPPAGGPAEKIKISSVIANRGAGPTAKSCRRSAAKLGALASVRFSRVLLCFGTGRPCAHAANKTTRLAVK
ncbi:hypothetical protein K227x_13590 [Rubripirellula lacrimiformis]|uniref:Uncharacterized protein n=1 Tax=Rubripirellula lacrimiformis TaxID=1930273 RepID=A0A517N797_9BACT|nr:hypothetical protein K227x_13590 [Rubripirellula lacrimiformis]